MTEERYVECAVADAEMHELHRQANKWRGVRTTLYTLWQVACNDPQAGHHLRAWLQETYMETWDQYAEACGRAGEQPYENSITGETTEYDVWIAHTVQNTTQPKCTPKNAQEGENTRDRGPTQHRITPERAAQLRRNRPQSAG